MTSKSREEAIEKYWKTTRNVTLLFFLGWLVIAVIIPVLSPHVFLNVWIGNLPPLHWFMLTFVVITLGVALIFIYAAVMDRIDKRLRHELEEAREEVVVRRGV
ncbi:MAG: DUF4212 domain-containing protein [Pyrobaculum sp.]